MPHTHTLLASVTLALATASLPAHAQNTTPAAALQPSASPDPALRTYLAGNGFLARGLSDLAAAEYRKFLAANPGHPKAPLARYGLAVSLVRTNNHEAAERELTSLRPVTGFEYAAEVELLLGQCALRASRFDDAAKAFQAAIDKDPKSDTADDAAGMLVESLYRAGKFETAAAAAADMESRWPDSPFRPRAELIRGMCELARGENAAAAARLASLAESSDPAIKSRASLLAAQAAQRLGSLDKARQLYETAAQLSDKSTDKSDSAEALLGLGTLHLAAGRPDEAAASLDRLLSLPPPEHLRDPALIARARVHLEAGKTDRAADLLSRVAPGGPSADQAEYYLAKCELRSGNPRAASRRLAAALASFPESTLAPEMCYDRAVALVRAEDDEAAATAASDFLTRFPDHALRPDALELLAGIELRRGNHEASLKLCREFLEKYAESPRRTAVSLLSAENLTLLGKSDEAEAGLRSLSTGPDSAEAQRASLRLGLMLAAAGKDAEAEPLLTRAARAAKTDPSARPAVLALAEIAFSAKRWPDSDRLFRQYLAWGKDMPGASNAALKLGLTLARQNKHAEAVAVFDALTRTDDPEIAAHASFERAQSLASLGRTAEVTRAFEELAASNAPARFRSAALSQLGNLALAAGDPARAATYFDRAGKDAPASTRAESAFLRAQALVASGKFDEATATLADIDAASLPSETASRVAPLRALAASRRSRDEAALAALDKALSADIADTDLKNSLLYERAACLRALRRSQEAAAAFKLLAGQSGQTSQYATLELGVLESDAGNHASAADLFEKLRAARRADASNSGAPDQLWAQATYRLASARLAQAQPRPALAAAEELLKAGPPEDLAGPTLYVAGESALALGQHRRAASYFESFVKNFPADSSAAVALLRLGEAHAGSGDWAASKSAYDRFLEANSAHELAFRARFGQAWALENLGRHADAIDLYKRIVETHDGETAARSQFQIGECLFALKKYDQALAEFLKVEILYAYPEWSAAALYEAGRCLEAGSKPDLARQQYEAVQTKYAQTKWAAPASERLRAVAQGGDTSAPPSANPPARKRPARQPKDQPSDQPSQPKEKNP